VPIVAIALGVIFLDEMVGRLALIGTGLVVLGAWITSRPEE
jgi:drug/metabolite transporter (DMT)-like permease